MRSNETRARGPIDLDFANKVFDIICEVNIRHARIVMMQAVLETGWFRSPFLMSRKNLFGFKRKKYIEFASLKDSILFYREWQDRNMPPETTDYLKFLETIQYGSAGYSAHVSRIRWGRNCSGEPKLNTE